MILQFIEEVFNTVINARNANNINGKNFRSSYKHFFRDAENLYLVICKAFHEYCDHQTFYLEYDMSMFDKVWFFIHNNKSADIFKWILQIRIAWMVTDNWEYANTLFPMPQKDNETSEYICPTYRDGKFIIGNYSILASEDNLPLINEVWGNEYYSVGENYNVHQNNVIIDVGAYKGETALWFAKKTECKCKIYAFEVQNQLLPIIKDNITNNNLKDIIIPVHSALGAHNGSTFFYNNDYYTSCTENIDGEEVAMISLDTFTKVHKLQSVDFIKMNIEGGEIAAIQGARQTINLYKPRMAICCYHHFFDIIQIPLLIKDICNSYHIYFSHKSNTPYGTIFFASTDMTCK